MALLPPQFKVYRPLVDAWMQEGGLVAEGMAIRGLGHALNVPALTDQGTQIAARSLGRITGGATGVGEGALLHRLGMPGADPIQFAALGDAVGSVAGPAAVGGNLKS